MSLIRTALRLQAIEALNSDPVIVGLVQGRVYDSRISALDHQEPVPTILVTTEETKGEAWSKQNGGAPFGLHCDLILEIAMNVQVGDGADAAIAYVSTDRKLEAYLDLLEERAIEILTVGETAAARLLRSAVVKRVPRVASSRFATDQTGEKFAIRLLSLTIEMFTPEPDDPLTPPTGAYAALPEPLRTIAGAMPPGSSGADTCALLADKLSVASSSAAPLSPPPPFTGADMILAPQQLDPAVTPDKPSDLAAGRTIAVDATIS